MPRYETSSDPLPVLGNGGPGTGGSTSAIGAKVVSGGRVDATIVVVVVSGGNVVVVVSGSVVEVVVVVSGGNVVVVVVAGTVVVVVVGATVVVVVGATVVVVVVGGTGTSTVAVAEIARGGPPVTRRWAPCGSGPAGLPRYTAALPGAAVDATTVIAPGTAGIVECAEPTASVNTVVGAS